MALQKVQVPFESQQCPVWSQGNGTALTTPESLVFTKTEPVLIDKCELMEARRPLREVDYPVLTTLEPFPVNKTDSISVEGSLLPCKVPNAVLRGIADSRSISVEDPSLRLKDYHPDRSGIAEKIWTDTRNSLKAALQRLKIYNPARRGIADSTSISVEDPSLRLKDYHPDRSDLTEEFVLGGREASEDYPPSQVSILKNGRNTCGGALLDERTVLTAAHCLEREGKRIVVAGCGTGEASIKNCQFSSSIASVTLHENYDMPKYANDIALAKLKFAVPKHMDRIKFLALDAARSVHELAGKAMTVCGWGRTKIGSDVPSRFLKCADMSYIKNAECKTQLNQTIPDGMFCAKGYGTTSPHKGDSGSVLAAADGSPAGLVGFGDPKEVKPVAFTSVHRFKNWIKSSWAKLKKKPVQRTEFCSRG